MIAIFYELVDKKFYSNHLTPFLSNYQDYQNNDFHQNLKAIRFINKKTFAGLPCFIFTKGRVNVIKCLSP